jgi:hypothetical protein
MLSSHERFGVPDFRHPLLGPVLSACVGGGPAASVGAEANARSMCWRAISSLPARRCRSLITASQRYEPDNQLGGTTA